MSSAEWKEVELREIVKLIIDYRGKTPKKLGGDWSTSGYRVLSAKNIKTGQIVQENSIRFVDKDLYMKWMKDEINYGDILITSEAPFGEVYYWNTDEKIVLSQRLFGVRINDENYSRYIYYYMTSEKFQSELNSRATGTTVIGLRQPELLKCKIVLPSYEEQKAIADILSSLDDKIELNNQMNKTLEEMAQAIFKHWFVDFEFPDENGEPYKSSGGEMVESELGMIPKGWEVSSLGEVTDLIKDGTHNPPKRVSDGIPLVTGITIKNGFINYEKMTYICEEDYKKIHKNYQPQKEDLLITKIGTLGKVAMIREEDLPVAIHCNSALIRFKNNLITSMYGYYLFKSSNFQFQFKRRKNQTVQEFINLKQISDIPIVLPPLKIIKKFDNYIRLLFEKVSLRSYEICILSQIRELLLPRLMSGEIRIKEDNND